MKTRILFFTLFILSIVFIISCNNEGDAGFKIKECPDFDVEEGTITDEREYQIIDAVINNNFFSFQFVHIISIPQNIIIGNSADQVRDYLSDQEIELDNELIETYVGINSAELKWKDIFQEGELKGEEEKQCLYSNNELECESYQNKYPNGSGFLNFTRPAFLEEDTAVVEYLVEYCSGGSGVFVILKFENENWVVDDFFTTIVT